MSRLDEIKGRCERATKGPWVGSMPANDHRFVVLDTLDLPVCHVASIRNTDFIAHAREDVPWLLAEVERLTTVRAARDQWIVDALNLLDELRSEYAMEHDAYSRLWDAIEAIEPEEANPNG